MTESIFQKDPRVPISFLCVHDSLLLYQASAHSVRTSCAYSFPSWHKSTLVVLNNGKSGYCSGVASVINCFPVLKSTVWMTPCQRWMVSQSLILFCFCKTGWNWTAFVQDGHNSITSFNHAVFLICERFSIGWILILCTVVLSAFPILFRWSLWLFLYW